ncbi:MAG: hypothetical protein QNJ62_06145 [Methyloceanibacter sp.]|nr:hypothetical protein [Methyloceanibacter sp.]
MLIIWALSAILIIRGRGADRYIAAALLVSWIAARTATVTESVIVLAAGLTIAAGISYAGGTRESVAIAALYGLRVLLLVLVPLGVASWFVFWELNRVLLYLQILIAFGGVIGGMRFRRPDTLIARAVQRYNIFMSKRV